MKAEAEKLRAARAHLARAETDYATRDGLAHLQEGLALVEEIAVDGDANDAAVAENLFTRYAERIGQSIQRAVDADQALAEPELEHLFRVLLAFDAADLDPPASARALKIEIVRRLVDFYYEGHSEEDKQRALRQLAGITEAT